MGLKILFFLFVTGFIAYYIYTPLPDAMEQKLKVMMIDAVTRTLYNVVGFVELLGLKPYIHALMLFSRGEDVAAVSDENVTVTDTVFNGIPVRVFIPTKQNKDRRRGLLYFHGGGWCTGSAGMNTYDLLARMTANAIDAVVVSVSYRLAPEYHFPTQFEDVYTVTKYFLQDHVLSEYFVDRDRIGVSGDSAGGNLAAAVVLQVQEDKNIDIQLKVQALIYPALQAVDFDTPSYQQNKHMPLLSRSLMVRFWSEYFTNDTALYKSMMSNRFIPLASRHTFAFVNWEKYLPEKFRKGHIYSGPQYGNADLLNKYPGILDSRACPLLAEETKLKTLPKTYVITCEYDVLRDDGIMYVSRVKEAGIHVTHYHCETCFHGILMFEPWPFYLEAAHKVLINYINWLDANL
ncbi:arylacetamide deacetylase-like [Protopterus annectens]|uniref:arylacetamide deacetylase-like n=1 Tax=Protopterus annectens TaxID=7888 RepID=UPI001CFC04D4|nr:arylacetamide deacetylase-like [Protopterus annectens]